MPAGNKQKLRANSNWEKAGGVFCPTCNNEVVRVYGPLRQCFYCFHKEKNAMVERTNCVKCNGEAVKLVILDQGIMVVKVTCPECGTYEIKNKAA